MPSKYVFPGGGVDPDDDTPCPDALSDACRARLAADAPDAPDTSGMRINDSIEAVALYKFPMMTITSKDRQEKVTHWVPSWALRPAGDRPPGRR